MFLSVGNGSQDDAFSTTNNLHFELVEIIAEKQKKSSSKEQYIRVRKQVNKNQKRNVTRFIRRRKEEV